VSSDFQQRLAERAAAAGIALVPDVAARVETYYRLLATWNQKINLTGLDLSQLSDSALDRLLIEPIAAAAYAPAGARVIDIGSGGGSPAIPFAIAAGARSLRMIESKTRKSVFLREAARAVQLPAVEIETARFEELIARADLHEAHDILTIRAVRVEPAALRVLQHFIAPGGVLFLFRGPSETAVPPVEPLAVAGTYPLSPALASQLLVLEKRADPRLD
jgi:16S rRNA (guanine527-N7)-methyltransferase